MNTEPKLCKNCEYFKQHGLITDHLSECNHPSLEKYIDLISGEKIIQFAAFMRGERGECSPDGKLFEPRKSFWQRVLGD